MKYNKIIIIIIAIVVMFTLIGGVTFAYFQWTTNENQQTIINIAIEEDVITMNINPEEKVISGLYPTNDCANGRYGDALVTVVNKTDVPVFPSFKLSVKVTKGPTGTLTSTDLSHIHYAITSISTTKDASGNAVKGNVIGSCNSPLTAENNGDNTYFSNDQLVATGTFESVSTNGAWSDLPNSTGTYLPRQYNTNTKTVSGVTFKASKEGTDGDFTTHQYFRVYVWLDSEYTTTNIGNNINDPLQNAKIEITWSSNSMLEQVAY